MFRSYPRAIEAGLSDTAMCFIRCNPGVENNPLAMLALQYMDMYPADAEYEMTTDQRESLAAKYKRGGEYV